jgi:hypothetical protein
VDSRATERTRDEVKRFTEEPIIGTLMKEEAGTSVAGKCGEHVALQILVPNR